ncbi:MAG: MBOAT family O-acyltransferase [Actinomycetota bacterium]
MSFTSLPFAVFLLTLLAGFAVLKSREQRMGWLLLGGVVFYGYWDWRFLLLIGFTSVFDYYMGQAIGAAKQPHRKRLLIADVVVNLSLLATFKYLNFFIDSANVALSAFGTRLGALEIILPIGISFFVFEAISYCVDIYRDELRPCTQWTEFALFIFFFPRMISGPIIRPADFLPQLQRRIELTTPNVIMGGQQFLVGMTKKLVIADNVAGFSDLVFGNPTAYSGFTILQATLAYSIQIFCDFSGYSDMAVGLAKVLGFDLPANFRTPYAAANLTDFWRRWHISLSSWLRDYLYIPLGGSRHGTLRTYLNLFITMTLGGLWHGASWHFVAWGALQGAGLAVHKFYLAQWPDTARARASLPWRVLSWLLTFAFVLVAWIVFRCQTLQDAGVCISRIVTNSTAGIQWISVPLLQVAVVVLLAHFAAAVMRTRKPVFLNPARFSHLVLILSWVVGIFFLAAANSSPFIYFQF